MCADAGESLSLSSVLALSSCISMLRAATSKGAQMDDDEDGSTQQSGADGAATAAAAAAAPAATTGVCSVSVNGLKLVSLDVPCGATSTNAAAAAPTVYTLVAQGNADESDAFLTRYLTDVREVLRAYLGGPPLASALPDDGSAVKAIAVCHTHSCRLPSSCAVAAQKKEKNQSSSTAHTMLFTVNHSFPSLLFFFFFFLSGHHPPPAGAVAVRPELPRGRGEVDAAGGRGARAARPRDGRTGE